VPSAEVQLGYGNYSRVDGSLYATSGLGHDLAANIAVYARNQSGGWGSDLVTGETAFTHRDLAGRIKLTWTPRYRHENHAVRRLQPHTQ
jgi:iron complex outermembrane recepter protein